MKIKLQHLGFNGRDGMATAVILGPAPASNLDRPAELSIQACFFIARRGTHAGITAHISADIPASENQVHISFFSVQEIPGSDGVMHKWPPSEELRLAFVKMLAGVLSHTQVELS
jgi:hypothetical protein